jgi:hypothetical protein
MQINIKIEYPYQSQIELRERIIEVLKKQGFKINPHVKPKGSSKTTYREIQQKARFEQLSLHKNFLEDFMKNYCKNDSEIVPDQISLELRDVQSGSFEEVLFRWWNLIWWSIPFQRPYGRQMRFLLWDTTHDAPFGLICLQSSVLKISVRDNYLRATYWKERWAMPRLERIPEWGKFSSNKFLKNRKNVKGSIV